MFYVFPGVGTLFNLTAFVVVVLGGMGSVPGALLGGLIIGIVEALSSTYISLDLAQLFTFLIFLAVLFFRPSGLFGGARNEPQDGKFVLPALIARGARVSALS